MREHINSCHKERKLFSCEICAQSFLQIRSLDKHKKVIHATVRTFSCQKCCKVFPTPKRLTVHERTCQVGLKIDCGICGKQLKCRSSLKTHTQTQDERVSTFEFTYKSYS